MGLGWRRRGVGGIHCLTSSTHGAAQCSAVRRTVQRLLTPAPAAVPGGTCTIPCLRAGWTPLGIPAGASLGRLPLKNGADDLAWNPRQHLLAFPGQHGRDNIGEFGSVEFRWLPQQ